VTGRELFAGLHLLDRQLVDRDGRLCGKVDDLELTSTPEGTMYVTAIVSGAGALWYRLGRRRLGTWLRTHVEHAFGDRPDPDRIPMRQVSDIGPSVHLNAKATELATAATETWMRDHIISHIPGSRHRAAE
jgi:hypothetical protein